MWSNPVTRPFMALAIVVTTAVAATPSVEAQVQGTARYGPSTEAVAHVIQWTCHGGANQQWRLEPAGGGAFRIIARHSAQALDVFGALVDDATPIIQYPVTGGDNQAWTLEPVSDGYVRIVARHSGKAMDVEFASTDDGAHVIQYTPHGNANQQWILRPVN